jgi:hypothetical protein
MHLRVEQQAHTAHHNLDEEGKAAKRSMPGPWRAGLCDGD